MFIRGFLLLLITAHTCLAQPAPKLNSISPEWVQRGTTIEVTLTGENLSGVTQILFNGDAGLTATNVLPPEPPKPSVVVESTSGGITQAQPAMVRDEKKLVVKITAPADSSLTPRELRVVAPGGVSNPLNLNVGQWPEVAKRDGNSTLDTAQSIDLPAVISGRITAQAQTNLYRFKAKKGEELVFEVDAARRGSPLDSSLAVVDAKGNELARNEDALGLDSLLFFTVPEDGEYLVHLRDYRYRGGNEYAYRLSAGPIPYVESVFPFGGQRGKAVDVAITGRNLDGTKKMTLNIDAKARRTQEIRIKTPRGYSNLVPFDSSDFPEVAEAEPNDANTNAQVVTAPVVINGRIGAAKDADRFKVKSAADQKLVIEAAAGRFGSRLDALITLSDTNGNMIAQNDDAVGNDARLEFDAKKDTEYYVSLRDLTDRGGERFGYRLSVRPPSAVAGASFTASFLPDALRLHRDGTSKIRCEVARAGGFDGPVRFTFDDLPTGVFAEPIVVPNGPASGLMLLTASKDAPIGSFPVRLTATGIIGGKNVTVTATPLAGDRPVRQAYLSVLDATPFRLELATLSASVEQGQSVTLDVIALRREGFANQIKLSAEGFNAGREAISKSFDVAEAVIKDGETMGKITLKARMDSEIGTRTIIVGGLGGLDGRLYSEFTQPIPVTVTQYPLVLSSTLPRLSLTVLPPGSESAAGEAETKIRVDRRAGFNGDVELSIEGLPEGVKSEVPKIPAGVGEVSVKLFATDKSKLGTNFNLRIQGTAVFNDRNYKTRTGNIGLSIASPEAVEVASTNVVPAAVEGTK